MTVGAVADRVADTVGAEPAPPRRPWLRWVAVLAVCAVAGVATGLVIAGLRWSPTAQALELERAEAEGHVTFTAVTADNPLLLDTTGCAASAQCAFLLAKVHLGEADLRGLVASRDLSACGGGECASTLDAAFAEVTGYLDMLSGYGLRNLPVVTRGADAPLVRPDSGQVADTAATPTAGSELIVAEARRASVQRPLLVVSAWPPTSVATAYLADPSIADRVVVALQPPPAAGASGETGQPGGSWAADIVTDRFRTILSAPPTPPPAPGDPFVARIEAELPPGPLRDALLARTEIAAEGDLVGDAAFAMLLYSPETWRAVGQAGSTVAVRSFDLARAEQEWFATMADPALHGGRAAPPPPPPPPPPAAPAFAVNVDFAPADAAVPDGWAHDTGAAFGDRANGLRFGWDQSVEGDTRARGLVEDVRYDTFAHFSKNGDRTWELEVPNGTYDVRVTVGDAEHTDSWHRLDVEGTLTADEQQDHFDTQTATVVVADGRLTIRPGEGAQNAKVCFLELTQR